MVISVKYKKTTDSGLVSSEKLVTSLDSTHDKHAIGDYIYNAFHSGRKPEKIVIKELPTETTVFTV